MIEFLQIIKDDSKILFVIDEVGFGGHNDHLRKYGYAKIGERAILEVSKKLPHNLTCTATISPYCVEGL